MKESLVRTQRFTQPPCGCRYIFQRIHRKNVRISDVCVKVFLRLICTRSVILMLLVSLLPLDRQPLIVSLLAYFSCCPKFLSFPWNSVKDKAVPLQAWSGPEGSRKLRLPNFMKTAQDGGKVVSLTQRPPLPPGNAPVTHLC